MATHQAIYVHVATIGGRHPTGHQTICLDRLCSNIAVTAQHVTASNSFSSYLQGS
ncbi:hypothetical protein LVY74_07925 [Acinetobacter sp. ME22]|uniref:hypothetical protein n=1 Tax=Acinetobacter sp. ME22 TaxID=2904802 RepID=UPI001EDC06FD|nr:hypothetical protein [Acinetobacter sp. ME22]MCG2573485.1 hypothetical protein [Acinetobacter sp. ME22]